MSTPKQAARKGLKPNQTCLYTAAHAISDTQPPTPNTKWSPSPSCTAKRSGSFSWFVGRTTLDKTRGKKEHSLLQDGWVRSGLNPALSYYTDPEQEPDPDEGQYRCWLCGWKSDKKNKKRGLRMHINRKKHKWSKNRSHLTEKKDIKKMKLSEQHDRQPHVFWGDKEVINE